MVNLNLMFISLRYSVSLVMNIDNDSFTNTKP